METTAENGELDDVCVLWLCETERVMLRTDLLYRFEVKDGCARCEELAKPYRSARALPPGTGVTP